MCISNLIYTHMTRKNNKYTHLNITSVYDLYKKMLATTEHIIKKILVNIHVLVMKTIVCLQKDSSSVNNSP